MASVLEDFEAFKDAVERGFDVKLFERKDGAFRQHEGAEHETEFRGGKATALFWASSIFSVSGDTECFMDVMAGGYACRYIMTLPVPTHLLKDAGFARFVHDVMSALEIGFYHSAALAESIYEEE